MSRQYQNQSWAGSHFSIDAVFSDHAAASLRQTLSAAVARTQSVEEPAVVFAEHISRGACMLHLMEQSFRPKMFQIYTASLLPTGERTLSDCTTRVADADGLGPLPPRSDVGSSCERQVRQALFLRGYCEGLIDEYKALGLYHYLPSFDQPGAAEEVTWATADGDHDAQG